MSWQDNTLIFFENQVLNGSGTSYASNVIDTQGSDNVTTNAQAAGFGAGPDKYFVVNVPVAFSSVTSVQVKLRTSDSYTVATSALGGSPVTLWDSTAVTIAGGTISSTGVRFPSTPTIVPKNGALQYLDVQLTTVGASSNEVGSITAFLTEDVNALQAVSYPPSAFTAN